MGGGLGDFSGMPAGAMMVNWAGFGGCDLGGSGSRERRGLGAHGLINQEIVVGIDRAAVIEITVAEPLGRCPIGITRVDQRVVIGIEGAAQVGVAVIGVFDQDRVGVDGLAIELAQDRRAVPTVIDERAECGDPRIGRAGGGAADARAVPSASVAASFEKAI